MTVGRASDPPRPRRSGKAFVARLRVRAEAERGPFARAAMWVRLSEAETDAGRVDAALLAAERACEESPDAVSLLRVAECLAATSRENEAALILARVAADSSASTSLRARIFRAEVLARRGLASEASLAWRSLLGVHPVAYERDACFGLASAINPPKKDVEGPSEPSDRPRWRRTWSEAAPGDLSVAEETVASYLALGEPGAALVIWNRAAENGVSGAIATARCIELALRAKRTSDVIAMYVLYGDMVRGSDAMPKVVRELRSADLGELEHYAVVRDVELGVRSDVLGFRRALAAAADAEGDEFGAACELWRSSSLLDARERHQALIRMGFTEQVDVPSEERELIASKLRALHDEAPDSVGSSIALVDSLLRYPDLHEAYSRLGAELWLTMQTSETALHALRSAVLSGDTALEDDVVMWLRSHEHDDARWAQWSVRCAWRRSNKDDALARATAWARTGAETTRAWAMVVRAAEAVGDRQQESEAWAKLADGIPTEIAGVFLAAAARCASLASQAELTSSLASDALQLTSSVVARRVALAALCSTHARPSTAAAWVSATLEARPETALWLDVIRRLMIDDENVAAASLLRALETDRYLTEDILAVQVELASKTNDATLLRKLFHAVTESGRMHRDVASELALRLLIPYGLADLRAAEGSVETWLTQVGVTREEDIDALLRASERLGSDRIARDALRCRIDRIVLSRDARASAYAALASRHANLGESDAEARAVAEALLLTSGASGELDIWASQLLEDDRGLGGDARLALVDAVVTRRRTMGDPHALEVALRTLATLRWELAEDRSGAMSAWAEAAAVNGDASAYVAFSATVVRAMGPTEAFDAMSALADEMPTGRAKSYVCLELAALALATGRPELAFRYARPVVTDPTEGPRAMSICERTGTSSLALAEVYELMAGVAAGRRAARAVYSRASLQFERIGHAALAFDHALRALAVDPSSELAADRVLVTVGRAAEPERAVVALEKASARARDAALRVRLRVDAAVVLAARAGQCARAVTRLVDAFSMTSDAAFVLGLSRLAPHAAGIVPSSREAVGRELDRALDHAVAAADAHASAAAALSIANFALEMSMSPVALRALGVALAKDVSSAGYELLLRHAAELAKSAGAASLIGKTAGEVLNWAKPTPSVLELLAAMAALVDARVATARFQLRKAEVTGSSDDRDAAIAASRGLPDPAVNERLAKLTLIRTEDPHARDHEAYIGALAERIDSEDEPSVRVMLRLRRAAVLHDRLGRSIEAKVELEEALKEVPDHTAALRFLQDILLEMPALA